MRAGGPHELLGGVFDRDLCIGCGACVSLCPYFKSYKGKTSMLFPCTRSEGRCFAYCPKIEVDLDDISRAMFGEPYAADSLGRYRSVHIARAGKNVGSGTFQAGGTVSGLVMHALKTGSIDAAVLTGRNGLNPVPAVVTDINEVAKHATSTYTAAPTIAMFNRASQEGYERIGIVVTPCQALALAQIRRNPTNEKNYKDRSALVVGLFCTWSLDYRKFRTLIAEHVGVAAVRKFDLPPPPAEIMEVHTDNGIIEIPLPQVRERVPHSCDYCFDMTAEFADVSVGVLEGRTDMNTLIIRTERGEKAVEEAVRDGYITLGELPAENLDHLRAAAGNKKMRAFKKANDEGLINTPPDKNALFRIPKETIKRI
ncbi:MAG: Coenzyme F420 hydrogenase/dehydrogenase, beta subunit C-terminal domain [Spirochaetes bacterium]|nr:Coenzyme F420 hydrogenase/dehydrogenase, beta subunit C-terminal domain [Spirochaetota bacterium]